MQRMAAVLVAVTIGLVGGQMAGGPVMAVAGAAAAGFVAALLWIAGPVGTVMGISLYLIAPGVLGESSFLRTLVALLLQLAVLLAMPSVVRHTVLTHRRVLLLLAVPVLVSTTFFLRYPSFGFLVAAWQVVWFNLVLLLHRPRAVEQTMKALATILFALSASYAVSLLIGFHSPRVLTVGQRTLTLYLPATLTTGGDQSILGAPRFGPGVGEPGLTAFYLIPLAVYFAYRQGWRRWAGWAGLVCVALFSQSTGILVGGLASAGLATSAYLLQTGRIQRFVLLLVSSAAIGTVAVQSLISTKAATSAASFSDRGIGAGGTMSAAAAGDINLLRIFQVDPAAAIPMALALVMVCVAGLRQPATLFAATFFALTAMFLQPTQWLPGAWEMLLMSLVLGWQQANRAQAAPVGLAPSQAMLLNEPILHRRKL